MNDSSEHSGEFHRRPWEKDVRHQHFRFGTLALAAMVLTLSVRSAGATAFVDISELTWDEGAGIASVSGSFALTSAGGWGGDAFQLTAVGFFLTSQGSNATNSGYTYQTNWSPPIPFDIDGAPVLFENIEVSVPSLHIGETYSVKVYMQRWFDWAGSWSTYGFSGDAVATAVPEPGTALLFGLGLAGMGLRKRHPPTRSQHSD